MDVEDEDDEGADSQNASTDQDVLETSMNSQGLGEESGQAEEVVAGHSRATFQNTVERLESEEALELSQE